MQSIPNLSDSLQYRFPRGPALSIRGLRAPPRPTSHLVIRSSPAGATIRLPVRIVSLLPSATEILLAITGRADHPLATLVGRSHECDWPPDPALARLPVLIAQRTRFESSRQIDAAVRESLRENRSLYTLDSALLASLRPDLIITQDLCEVCSIDLDTVRGVAAAMTPTPRILSLNPATVEDVLDDILRVGEAIGGGFSAAAANTAVLLRERLFRAEEFVTPHVEGPNVAFLEWTDPLFIGGHWTPQLIERAGGRHPLNPTVESPGSGAAAGPIGQSLRAAGKSISIPPQVLVASRPDVVLICPCGLSLDQAWRETEAISLTLRGRQGRGWWHWLPAVQNSRVAVIDGSHMFNRPGPRLIDAFEFLVGYLNDRPELIPSDFPWRPWRV